MKSYGYSVESNQKACPPTQSPEYLFVNKGDQLKLDVSITINGCPYALKTGESIWFDVKKYTYNTENTPVLIHIEQEGTRIVIPEIKLEVGDYVFDIGIIHADGTTKTLLPSIKNRTNKLVVGNRVGNTSGDIRGDIYTDVYAVKLTRDQCSNCDKDYDKKLQYLQKRIDCLDVATGEMSEDIAKSFIVVDTIDDLSNISTRDLVDGKIAKVNRNEDGVVAYYSYNQSSKRWFEEPDTRVDPRAFITVSTLQDLLDIPEHELVNGKLARVNRPKSDSGIQGVVFLSDPESKDYDVPRYFVYDSEWKKWIETDEFSGGSGSGVTEGYVIDKISDHNTSSTAHPDIRNNIETINETLESTMISVDTHDDLFDLTKSSIGRLVRVADDDGNGTTKYYVAIDNGELGIDWEEESFGSADGELSNKVAKVEQDIVKIEEQMSWENLDEEIKNI